MTNSKLVNPFYGIEKTGSFSRISTSVDREDYAMLKRLRIQKGTIEATINTLYVKLITELKRRGITDFTKVSEFEHFVSESRLLLPGEPNEPLVSPAQAPNVSGGATSGDSKAPTVTVGPASIQPDRKRRGQRAVAA